MRVDLRNLELFAAVADAGGIARAAERSHTVASAVSKREESLGCALLVRGVKGVELTAVRHALLMRVRVLLHQAIQLQDEMRGGAATAYIRSLDLIYLQAHS